MNFYMKGNHPIVKELFDRKAKELTKEMKTAIELAFMVGELPKYHIYVCLYNGSFWASIKEHGKSEDECIVKTDFFEKDVRFSIDLEEIEMELNRRIAQVKEFNKVLKSLK